MPSVLVPLFPGFEEIETVTPVDLLRRAGASVTLASGSAGLAVTGRCGMTLLADATLAEALAANPEPDLLLIPGGPAVPAMRADGRVTRLAAELYSKNKHIAAICAAPTVLADAGLLRGRAHTAHFSVYPELTDADASRPVVTDGRITTSRGAGTADRFGLELVRVLFGEAKADEIARAIMT